MSKMENNPHYFYISKMLSAVTAASSRPYPGLLKFPFECSAAVSKKEIADDVLSMLSCMFRLHHNLD